MSKKIGTEKLRKALIRQHYSGANTKSVYFHKFYNKVYEEGETHSSVLYEEISGKVSAEHLSNCTFTFCSDSQFIENLTEVEVQMLLHLNSEITGEEKLENKLELINAIKNYAPKNADLNRFIDLDVGYWNEDIVAGWKWKFKQLLKLSTEDLRDFLNQFMQEEKYG